MFGLRAKLPLHDEERLWVDEGFRRLSRMLGSSRLLNAPVVLPTDQFFPDAYEPNERGLTAIFRRVCGYMNVDPRRLDLEVIPDSTELIDMLPAYSYGSEGPAGLHFSASDDERPLIAVRQSLLKDPLLAVATLAHELGHVILLGGGHMRHDVEDMEPITDLVTVYLGLGIFTANAARQFRQFQDDRRQGWSMNHLGYLPEEVFAYALARFAKDRGEIHPPWITHLSTNLKVYFRRCAEWLEQDARPIR